LFIHPHSPVSVEEFLNRLSVGDLIPTWFVAVTAPVFVAGATLMACTCPSLEKLEEWSGKRSSAVSRQQISRHRSSVIIN
jgi:hypothetical protein